MKRIAVIPGDGIGPEVIREAVHVLERVRDTHDVQLQLTHFDWGAESSCAKVCRYLRARWKCCRQILTPSWREHSVIRGFLRTRSPKMCCSVCAGDSICSSTCGRCSYWMCG